MKRLILILVTIAAGVVLCLVLTGSAEVSQVRHVATCSSGGAAVVRCEVEECTLCTTDSDPGNGTCVTLPSDHAPEGLVCSSVNSAVVALRGPDGVLSFDNFRRPATDPVWSATLHTTQSQAAVGPRTLLIGTEDGTVIGGSWADDDLQLAAVNSDGEVQWEETLAARPREVWTMPDGLLIHTLHSVYTFVDARTGALTLHDYGSPVCPARESLYFVREGALYQVAPTTPGTTSRLVGLPDAVAGTDQANLTGCGFYGDQLILTLDIGLAHHRVIALDAASWQTAWTIELEGLRGTLGEHWFLSPPASTGSRAVLDAVPPEVILHLSQSEGDRASAQLVRLNVDAGCVVGRSAPTPSVFSWSTGATLSGPLLVSQQAVVFGDTGWRFEGDVQFAWDDASLWVAGEGGAGHIDLANPDEFSVSAGGPAVQRFWARDLIVPSETACAAQADDGSDH